MAKDRDLIQAKREIQAVNKALKDGFPPTSLPGRTTERSAIREAADRLAVDDYAFSNRVGSTRKKGLWWKRFKLQPNWTLFKPKPVEDVQQSMDGFRQKRSGRDLANENTKLREALAEAQDLRSGVLKLLDQPLRPTLDVPRYNPSNGERTVIIHLSDWHVGEFVDLGEMAGLNCYSIPIFQKRVGRLGAAAKELLTLHWKGRPPEKIILIFGGDMITGEIHDELAKTNDALSAPAVRECAERLAGFVKLMREIAPVDIYSLPGNHGRLTKKPESKAMAINSFDTLITQIVEMCLNLGNVKGVRFFYPKSGDALFKVYHLTFCAAHGDRIGSRGGQGFIGALATIIRGVAKTRAYYTAQGTIVDYILVGHFHTTSKLPRGFSNGSLIGPSEYSRDLRADPETSKQNLIVVHSQKGVIDFRELLCGDKTEGAIH